MSVNAFKMQRSWRACFSGLMERHYGKGSDGGLKQIGAFIKQSREGLRHIGHWVIISSAGL